MAPARDVGGEEQPAPVLHSHRTMVPLRPRGATPLRPWMFLWRWLADILRHRTGNSLRV